MLVLSRKAGERIQIADVITLTILSVNHGRVRLGFAAPSHIPVHREEVRRRIDEQRVHQDSQQTRSRT